MAINNFKELQRQELADMGSTPSSIEKNISHNMGLFRCIGDIAELYLPHVGRLFIQLIGGNENKTQKGDYLNQDPIN
ncbi:MAG: hypothetical protein ABI844_12285 [Saprospiraceae bacterium]